MSEKDAALCAKDRELGEARCEAGEKGRALAKALEEVTEAKASLDATQRSLRDLEKKHSEVLGELAGRERGIADKGSELEKLQKDHARAVAERDAMLAAKEEMLTTVRGEVAEKSQALGVATEESLRLMSSLTALSKETTSKQTNTTCQAILLLRGLDAVRRIV